MDEFGGLTLIEPLSDPFRLFAFDTFAVEQIDCAIELKQHAAQRFQFFGHLRLQTKWGRGDAPFVSGEQSPGGHLVADKSRDLRRRGGGRRRRNGFHARTVSVELATVKNERMGRRTLRLA